mmetsp:Transcript_3724/g.6349  ORF Transcript_3724/g.6349 Transcript_3724/m.6349 type:complete len:204 (-) Transcript_3724:16-627(-)
MNQGSSVYGGMGGMGTMGGMGGMGGYGGMGGMSGYGGMGGMSGYGGSMYGGGYGGGMYGGGYGGGMYGRPMGMGAQGGMFGSSMQYLSTMQGVVYQICETGQMIQYNSHGLLQFLQLTKQLLGFLVRKATELVQYLRRKFSEAYKTSNHYLKVFIEEYLLLDNEKFTQSQLERQMKWIGRIIKVLLLVALVDFMRKMVRMSRT